MHSKKSQGIQGKMYKNNFLPRNSDINMIYFSNNELLNTLFFSQTTLILIFPVPSESELACGNPVGFVPLTPPTGGPTSPLPVAPLKLEAQI